MPAKDLGYACRLLRRNPAFTLAAVTTLALCIGANTAIYSIVDAVLFRPLPYPQPHRLATIATLQRDAQAVYEQTALDGARWLAVHERARSIDAAVFSQSGGVNFVGPGGAQYVKQQRVSAGFFRVLDVPPVIGREFTETEDRIGGPAVTILGNDFWRRAFHSDPSVAGRKITLRGEPYTVIGVMPPGFQTSEPAALWTPLRPTTSGEGSGTNYGSIARLRPGVSWAQADAEVRAVGQDIIREWRLKPGQSAALHLIPLQRGLTQDLRKPLLILWAAVGLVLLIGCVNIASLLLARAGARSREIATRMALGSGRAAVVRQLLAESLLLATAGGAAGVLLGWLAIGSSRVLLASTLGLWQTLSLDARVLAVTGLISLATSLVFGFYPALQTTRLDIRSALAQAGTRVSTANRGWPGRLLVVTEVALGVVLLIGAGLLIRTFAHLMGLQPGFDSHNVITASLSLQDARYAAAEKVNALYDQSLARVREIPGVEAAAVGLSLPYQRALNDGFTRLDGSDFQSITNLTYITPDYFKALRMTLRRGRGFTPADRAQSQPVAIVNEAFVRRYWAGQEALGGHIRAAGGVREIVGVAGDVQEHDAGWGDFGPIGPVPDVYVPAAQISGRYFQVVHTWFQPSWIVRTSAPLTSMAGVLQAAVASVDPQLPFGQFRTMDEIRSQSLAMQRIETALLSVLAGLALLLAAVGIYGLIANSVAERTRELGIRMALGSSALEAIRAVALPAFALASAGVVIGCILARVGANMLRGMIWGVPPADPATFAAVCAAILLVTALATLLPGLRVLRINPAQTLREE